MAREHGDVNQGAIGWVMMSVMDDMDEAVSPLHVIEFKNLKNDGDYCRCSVDDRPLLSYPLPLLPIYFEAQSASLTLFGTPNFLNRWLQCDFTVCSLIHSF